MVFKNFNGAAFWLIDDPQDASDAFQTTVSVFRDSTAGLTNREARRPFSELFRWQCQFQLTLEGIERITFETALATDPAALYAVPLWPLATPAADFALSDFTAGVWVAIDEPAAAQLFTTTPPAGLSAAAVVMPVALGTIAKRQTEAIGPDVARAVIDFTEASPAAWAIGPKAFAMVDGPLPSNDYPAPPKLCDFFLDFEKLGDSWTFKAYSEQIGFGRETQRETYPQTPAREFRGEFVLPTLTEAARFLSFVRAHFGGQSFWTPTWKLAALVPGPVAGGTISFFGRNNLIAGSAVAFVSLYSVDARKVTTADANGFTIDAPVGPFDADQFGVHELKLVRIRTTEQNINWLGNGVSRAALDFREVPAEYTIPADEILGGTIGALPLRVFLYDLETHLGATVNRGRYTSFEKDLAAAGGTYLARQINHSEIRQSTDLDRNEIDLDSENFAGNPLIDLAALRLYAPLFLTVQQATLAGGTVGNLEVIFVGEITGSETTGEKIKAKAVTGGTLFDRLLPRFTAQPTCNYALFSPGCTLLKDNWTFTAAISAPGTPGFPFVFSLAGLARVIGAPPVYTADYFAGGWLEFGTGAVREVIPVLRSTLPAGGVFDVTLSRDPRPPFPTGGETVVLYPGCDARRETCIGKFNNYANFGGHPFIPKANSSVVRPEASQNVGKK